MMGADDRFQLELTRSEAQELFRILSEERHEQIASAESFRGSTLRDECEIRADFCFQIMRKIARFDHLWSESKNEGE